MQLLHALDKLRQERVRQIDKGFDALHDDGHCHEEIVQMSMFYQEAYMIRRMNFGEDVHALRTRIELAYDSFWPSDFAGDYSRAVDSAMEGTPEDCLVKGAAMLVAEMQRIGRLEESNEV